MHVAPWRGAASVIMAKTIMTTQLNRFSSSFRIRRCTSSMHIFKATSSTIVIHPEPSKLISSEKASASAKVGADLKQSCSDELTSVFSFKDSNQMSAASNSSWSTCSKEDEEDEDVTPIEENIINMITDIITINPKWFTRLLQCQWLPFK